ncbi:hypothetical protein F5984_13070 [Rudanella paleaurantiibacter]|uniref:Uncharacterized protein n=1 Tax=Rudanella paleaurantiibacter TaxID=2614655 RepID=A0A7J5TY92_9BACT|nr:hypothetical protein [Rudanella paleaurantiibacter]KAB7730108.1 hypothetical protein F5984_13070 [Rudanella paleaurantiibacter]
MTNELEQIRKDHPFGFKGIFYSYDYNEIRESKPFWLSILCSVILLIMTYFFEKQYYDVVLLLATQIIAIFPNLLGFNLGGYALIVGFGNSDLLQSMTRKSPKKSTSIFQQLSGIFAFAILIQIGAFISAFFVNFVIQLKFDPCERLLANSVNIVVTSVLSFLGLWGLFIIPNLVSNVFTFGQMHHFSLTMKRMEAEKRKAAQRH